MLAWYNCIKSYILGTLGPLAWTLVRARIPNKFWTFTLGGWVVVFDPTFKHFSVTSWRSDVLVEESGVAGENHWPAVSHWYTLSHQVASCIPCLSGIQTHNISGDRHCCTGSCKSNYHMITATTALYSEKTLCLQTENNNKTHTIICR